MKILFFCTTWGQKHEPWDAFCRKAAAAGYDGIETGMPADHEHDAFIRALADHGLHFIAQHWETTDADFLRHEEAYRYRLEKLADLRPLLVNSHTGKDHFSVSQNARLIGTASRVAHDQQVPVVHETHRGRFAFAAHVLQPYLEQHPDIALALDISHWCAVAESLLADQADAVQSAIQHTRHIHARVGFEQGPQVPDPRLPVFGAAFDFHLRCWDRVVEKLRATGAGQLTITPEFGPWPYFPGCPGEQIPGLQWEINVYMMQLLRERYG